MDETTFTIPVDPDSATFPSRNELPFNPGATEGSAWIWGEHDQLGRLNLLTPSRVAAAAKEIRTGDIVPVNLPLNVPEVPTFGRELFKHEIKTLMKDIAYDDTYSLNTQSGTQWDGFRHCAHVSSGMFYNGTRSKDIIGLGANLKGSIHHWAEHGIAGRGILLDYRGYANDKGLVYDPHETHAMSYDELHRCGEAQGIDIRPVSRGGDVQIGDMLFVRTGFVDAYASKSSEEWRSTASRTEPKWAGLSQEEAVLDWLHDCYFSTVAGDAPAFENWPTQKDYYLHEYILALWGMPLGEMLDLEKLARTCRDKKKWTFFFTSAPANVPGGVASHVNGTAIF